MKQKSRFELQIRKEWKNILFNGVFAVLTLIISILFFKSLTIATIFIGILSIFALIKWKSKLTLVVYIFGAIFGAVSEMIAVNYGVWSYTFINLLNIPSWLFLVWGNAAALIYQTAVEFERLGVHERW
jgi:hypothetical protein